VQQSASDTLKATDDKPILVHNNVSPESQDATVNPGTIRGKELVDLFTSDRLTPPPSETWTLPLDRYGYRWLEISG
jgi:hypothetical protein